MVSIFRLFARVLLLSLSLFILTAPGNAAEPWEPLAKETPVLSEQLLERASEFEGMPLKAWVFFTDKGIASNIDYQKALNRYMETLKPQSYIRRFKTGRTGSVIHFHDLPVAGSYVNSVAAVGVKMRAHSRYLNAVSVEASIAHLEEIAAFSFVRSVALVRASTRRDVVPDGPPRVTGKKNTDVRYGLDYGASLTQLEMMQVPALHDMGYDGTGVRICILDTGFKRTHEALTSVNVIAEWDFVNDDGNTGEEPGDYEGQYSHGTKVLGLIGGYHPGDLIGPAYGAEFLLGKTEDMSQEQPIEEDWWVEGIEWADSMGADIVASSLGYNDWYTYEDMDGNTATTTIAADIAAINGILVCTSAGNEGESEWDYMTAPGDADSIITSGAVWSDTTLVYFSSRGPTFDGRIKPTVVAQGVYTETVDPDDDNGYTSCHGTSCSNPLIAGAAALLLQANMGWNNMDLIETIQSTATQSSAPDTAMGWGLIQAADALGMVTSVQNSRDLEAWSQKPSVQAPPSLTLKASPNPFNPNVSLSVNVLRDTRIRVRVFDARGAFVDTLFHDDASAGFHTIEWDGKDYRGRDVSSGIYFAYAEGAGVRVAVKLNLIR